MMHLIYDIFQASPISELDLHSQQTYVFTINNEKQKNISYCNGLDKTNLSTWIETINRQAHMNTHLKEIGQVY
jgi:hypothetical protein